MVRLLTAPFTFALRLLRSCARLHPAVFSVAPPAHVSHYHSEAGY